MKIIKYFLLLCLPFLASCSKEELVKETATPVNLTLKGAVLQDTLDFVLNGKKVGDAYGANFHLIPQPNGSPANFNKGDVIEVKTRSNGKLLGKINVGNETLQERKIYYDGTTFSDNIQLIPVSNANNIGYRMSFSSDFGDFYGGPVDVQIVLAYFDMNTFEFIETPVTTVKNVTADFGDFFELPYVPLGDEFKMYYIKIYKAGTTEPPFTTMEHTDFESNFGTPDYNKVVWQLGTDAAGTSNLLRIKADAENGRLGWINVENIAGAFQ